MNRNLKLLILLGLIGAAAWWLFGRAGEPAATSATSEAEATNAAAVMTGPRGVPELELGAIKETRASIAGTVTDEKGRAIAGAQVCAFVVSSLLPSADSREPKCTQTGKDGRYTLTGLFGVRQRVSAGAPGFVPRQYEHGEGAKRRELVELKPGAAVTGIDIRLQGGGVEIKGHVRDLSGGAVSGALVTVDAAVGFADAEGAFALWVKPGEATVNARADGYANGHEEGLAPGHVFEVFLTPEAVIVGRVVRASDGSPVEGARVDPSSGGSWWSEEAVAFTDAGGNFRLDRLRPGAYKPKATADDAYGVAEEQVVLGMGETSESVTITAHPAFTVEGRVVTDEGEACDAGWVTLADKEHDRTVWKETEADGGVRVQGVLPGEFKVSVTCTGFVAADKYDAVTVVDASVAGVKWEVTQGLAIRGAVVDDAGKPVPDMQLHAVPKARPDQPRAQQTSSWSGESDEQGRFELAGLLPGEYDVTVSSWASPRAVPRKPTPVTLAKGKDAEVKITLPATAELRGRVLDSDGKPVPKVTVALTGGAQYIGANAADDGTFVISLAPPGEYRAVARQGWDAMRAPGTRDDDPQGVKVTLVAGAREKIELVVESMSGKISGVVRAEGGPVVDAFVEASRETDSAASSSGSAMRDVRWDSYFKAPVMTDQDGRFHLTGLAPGKYTLRANRNGGGEALREHVEVGADVELAIAMPGSLAGTVKVRGGDAPEEFRVTVRDEKTGYDRGDSFFRTRGAWRLPELPAGHYKVTASAGEGSQEIELDLAASEQRQGVQIELAAKVTVRGTVVDLEGKPVAGLQVVVGGASYSGWDEEDKQNVTDEAGRYEVPRAPTGKVTLMVMPRSFGSSDEYGWTSMPAALPEGQAVVELPPLRVAKKRVKQEEVAGDLGYRIKQPEPGADPLQRVLEVAVVLPGGAAAAAGLQVGDVITQFDGHDVTGANAYLHNTLSRVLAGTVVTLGLARGATLQVTAGKKP